MPSKKVATAVDILVNVARFEHIKITKYAESVIEYDSEQDRIDQEDKLTLECIEDLIRGKGIIAETIGDKVIAPCKAIGAKISSKLPDWMLEGPEPNIANAALEEHEKVVAKDQAKAEDAKEDITASSKEVEGLLEDPNLDAEPSVETSKETSENKDSSSETVAAEAVATENKPSENSQSAASDDDDLFGGDDLFDE